MQQKEYTGLSLNTTNDEKIILPKKTDKTICLIKWPILINLGPEWPLFCIVLILSISLQFLILTRLKGLPRIVYSFIAITQVLSYAITGLRDPGYIKTNEPIAIKKCKPCNLQVGRGTMHCYSCGVCVKGFDHHCPWVGKCIGTKNLVFFKLFICSGVTSFISALIFIILT